MSLSFVMTTCSVTPVLSRGPPKTTPEHSPVATTAPGLCPGDVDAGRRFYRGVSEAAPGRDECDEKDRRVEFYRHDERVPCHRIRVVSCRFVPFRTVSYRTTKRICGVLVITTCTSIVLVALVVLVVLVVVLHVLLVRLVVPIVRVVLVVVPIDQ